MNFKKILNFAVKNYLLSSFIVIIALVCFMAFVQIIFSKPIYIYAKVKVGPGWYAANLKPSIWLVNALRKGDIEKDLVGRPLAEILSVRYYHPYMASNQFDVYLTLRLKVSFKKRNKIYIFKRSPIAVSSPIELEFPSSYIAGTVIDISKTRFDDKYVEKIVYLSARGSYSKDTPFLYDSIQIGDKYFDGEDNVFEVLDKQLRKNVWRAMSNLNGQIFEQEVDSAQDILVKAKLKLKKNNGRLILGEEYVVNVNTALPIITPNLTFGSFFIEKIE